jgi:hypothetical protein
MCYLEGHNIIGKCESGPKWHVAIHRFGAIHMFHCTGYTEKPANTIVVLILRAGKSSAICRNVVHVFRGTSDKDTQI